LAGKLIKIVGHNLMRYNFGAGIAEQLDKCGTRFIFLFTSR
jgi:hypothetical protein